MRLRLAESVSSHALQLIFTLIFIPASLRYLERLWGAVETAKFVVVTIVVSNIIAVVVNWLEYMLFANPVFLYVFALHMKRHHSHAS